MQEAVLDYAQYVSEKGAARSKEDDVINLESTCPMPHIDRQDIDQHTQKIIMPHAAAEFIVYKDTSIPKQPTWEDDMQVLQLSKTCVGYAYMAKVLDIHSLKLHIGLSTVAYMMPRVAEKVRQHLMQLGTLQEGTEIGAVTVVEIIPLSKMVVVEPVPLSRLAALHVAERLSYSRMGPYIADDTMLTDD